MTASDHFDQVSEAIVICAGVGATSWPSRDEQRLVDRFGQDITSALLPTIQELEQHFYESDAAHTAPDLVNMGDAAAARFRALHPELTEDAIRALAWCYTFDWK